MLTLPRILAILCALAVIIETYLMGRDNWRVERVLLAARLASRMFLLGVIIYLFLVVPLSPPLSSRSAMLMVAIVAFFTAETVHRITARKIKRDMGKLLDVK